MNGGSVGTVGALDGAGEGDVGFSVGSALGAEVGVCVVGSSDVGSGVGGVGFSVGSDVGEVGAVV